MITVNIHVNPVPNIALLTPRLVRSALLAGTNYIEFMWNLWDKLTAELVILNWYQYECSVVYIVWVIVSKIFKKGN